MKAGNLVATSAIGDFAVTADTSCQVISHIKYVAAATAICFGKRHPTARHHDFGKQSIIRHLEVRQRGRVPFIVVDVDSEFTRKLVVSVLRHKAVQILKFRRIVPVRNIDRFETEIFDHPKARALLHTKTR